MLPELFSFVYVGNALNADPVEHGFPIRVPRATPGPPVCVMRPAAIFVNCVYVYYKKRTIISAVMRTTC